MSEREQLEHAIATLEAQRHLLGDTVVDALAALARQAIHWRPLSASLSPGPPLSNVGELSLPAYILVRPKEQAGVYR